MTTELAAPEWTPPPESVPMINEGDGWWLAPNGDVYCDPAWVWPETPSVEDARTAAIDEKRRRDRRDAALVPELLERIATLEMREHLALTCFWATLDLLAAKGDYADLLEDLLAGVLSGPPWARPA